MLELLSLRNFKSARSLDVPIRQLTVLSGLNGSGKSTVLQALSLIRQSLHASKSTRLASLFLRGELVQLGFAGDVLSERADDGAIEIKLRVNGQVSRWLANAQTDSDVLPLQDAVGVPDPGETFLHNCNFQYLQADRLTPQTHYDRSDAINRQLGFLGAHGQYTPDYLAENGDRLDVSEPRRYSRASTGLPEGLVERIGATPKLYDQISGWLQYLSPGVRLEAAKLSQTDLVYLAFSYVSTKIAQDSKLRRPANVGFGLTYCLPILTACLAAPGGSVVLLENPEAHLHPQGQVALGTLLALCASDGVQIIVETHSDHVLNGVRLAVKSNKISADAVSVCNFTREPITGDSYIENPAIKPNGDLTAWPKGFFDEWEKSLEALLG